MIHRTEMTTPLVSPAARTVASAHYSVRRLDMAELPQANDLYSFPNEHSLSVYRRTPSLAEAGVCEVQVRILSWLPYLRWRLDGHGAVRQPQPAISRAPLEARGLGLVPIDRFDSDFDGIHAALASRVASFTLRRREFLNWRYFGSPTRAWTTWRPAVAAGSGSRTSISRWGTATSSNSGRHGGRGFFVFRVRVPYTLRISRCQS